MNAMISVNALKNRKGGFEVNNWIMDSGAFSQIEKNGKHTLSTDDYLEKIYQFAPCGKLRAAVCQDWMCEEHILEITNKSVREHQELTTESYVDLQQWSDIPIMAVLQGFKPHDYVEHLKIYGKQLAPKQWVGVGSVCKRNGNPDAIEDVLLAIKKERPDLRLHGFGIKIDALKKSTIRNLLYSSDSMAWSYADRKADGNGHTRRAALQYAARVQELIGRPSFVQEQLFTDWQPV
jgi:hypothetical protein